MILLDDVIALFWYFLFRHIQILYHFRKVGQQSQGESFKSKKRFFFQAQLVGPKEQVF